MDRFNIISIIIAILVIIGLLFVFISNSNVTKETIERCKSKGWDGAKFISFSNKMICSNMSQAEKDARGDSG